MGTQSRSKSKKRPRISVSLDPEDYAWVEELPGASASLSYKVSRVVKAARLAGVTIDDAQSPGLLAELRDWLKTKRKKSATVLQLEKVLSEFLADR